METQKKKKKRNEYIKGIFRRKIEFRPGCEVKIESDDAKLRIGAVLPPPPHEPALVCARTHARITHTCPYVYIYIYICDRMCMVCVCVYIICTCSSRSSRKAKWGGGARGLGAAIKYFFLNQISFFRDIFYIFLKRARRPWWVGPTRANKITETAIFSYYNRRGAHDENNYYVCIGISCEGRTNVFLPLG